MLAQRALKDGVVPDPVEKRREAPKKLARSA
jgi:hypothetical protein